MRFALMIEPQQDVTWELNLAIAQRAEAAGFETLYRSDHYESFPGPAGRRSTDAWATIAALARETTRLRHGTMVSPVTFRHPGNLAKVVATADELSGGRVELGIGAGWNVDEHRRHGLEFYDKQTRIEMMEESFQVIDGLWRGGPGWSFDGLHYQVEDARYGPVPVQQPRVPLIMGTRGVDRGLRAAAKWADHLNLYTLDPAGVTERLARFETIRAEEGRAADEIVTSTLCAVIVGADAAEYDRRRAAVAEKMGFGSVAEWEAVAGAWAKGTPDEAYATIKTYADAGVDMIVLQDFLPDDLDHIDLLGALTREWSSR